MESEKFPDYLTGEGTKKKRVNDKKAAFQVKQRC